MLAGRLGRKLASAAKGAGKQLKMDIEDLGTNLQIGSQIGDQISGKLGYDSSVFSPKYATMLRRGATDAATGERTIQPVENAAQMAGAYLNRGAGDLFGDATRMLYFKFNHPMPIVDTLSNKALGEAGRKRLSEIGTQSPTARNVILGASIGAPTLASMGHMDITNPGELFRAKGYAQSYAEKGSKDRRESVQPGQELFERMVQGRRGRPLRYGTAKEDIPGLTIGDYKDYMRHHYQDKGLGGLGLIKGTTKNLQGHPEARVMGFPFGLESAGAAAGGTMGLRAALGNPALGPAGIAARGFLGAATGIMAGKLMNQGIAQAQRPDPASTSEYAYTQGRRHLPTQGL